MSNPCRVHTADPIRLIGAGQMFQRATSADVLIDEHRVSIWVNQGQARRAGGRFVSFGREGQPTGFEATLNVANIFEFFERLGLARPTRVERE